MYADQAKPTISIVIPTRNEAQNLSYLLPQIPADIEEIILVDGHSTDDTIAVAQKLRSDIRIIQQTGIGKGDAMRAGFVACTQDIIVMLDADGSADPAEIPFFVDALKRGGDFAKGSRYLKGGGSSDITPLRQAGNWALCVLTNLLFREKFTDLCYGYNVFWRRCLDLVTLDAMGFDIEAQLCLRMLKAGVRMVEVSSMEHSRVFGESNLNTFKDGWLVLKVIVFEWMHQSVPQLAPKQQQSATISMHTSEELSL
ncbi:glycosyltransferase family 2 protein [Dictyobacter arantiisoli]|uniref:Glycosyltransferase 2-like domain-containing protein n=1 Tax=Dictyobacter arantiisoli TaxID=2014874 RepID=A0A5A5T956_9CHLR|nr:glycosyltransferase family 2 protein [Dictyobacter arantiisoli]GCF08021.1 hypothetical protein KDI_15850 [Dictyobacter arantiisoli]